MIIDLENYSKISAQHTRVHYSILFDTHIHPHIIFRFYHSRRALFQYSVVHTHAHIAAKSVIKTNSKCKCTNWLNMIIIIRRFRCIVVESRNEKCATTTPHFSGDGTAPKYTRVTRLIEFSWPHCRWDYYTIIIIISVIVVRQADRRVKLNIHASCKCPQKHFQIGIYSHIVKQWSCIEFSLSQNRLI